MFSVLGHHFVYADDIRYSDECLNWLALFHSLAVLFFFCWIYFALRIDVYNVLNLSTVRFKFYFCWNIVIMFCLCTLYKLLIFLFFCNVCIVMFCLSFYILSLFASRNIFSFVRGVCYFFFCCFICISNIFFSDLRWKILLWSGLTQIRLISIMCKMPFTDLWAHLMWPVPPAGVGLQQTFRVTPQSVQVVAGSDVTLHCEVDNQRGSVQWTKDGFALGTWGALRLLPLVMYCWFYTGKLIICIRKVWNWMTDHEGCLTVRVISSYYVSRESAGRTTSCFFSEASPSCVTVVCVSKASPSCVTDVCVVCDACQPCTRWLWELKCLLLGR